MASNVVYDAIRAELEASWTTIPLTFENEAFTPPTDGDGKPQPFVAVEMTGNLYGQQSIGAGDPGDNRWDEEGVLWLHIFVRSGTGGQTVRTYAKSLADIFRGKLLLGGAIEFMDASIGLGESGDDSANYYRVSVSIDWRRIDA